VIKKMIVIGSLLLIGACTSGVKVFSDPSIPIEVKVGDRFTIELDSNATTGYSSVFDQPVDETILRLVSTDYITAKSGLTGAGGSQVWLFQAIQPGTAVISLNYERSWEAELPIQTAGFIVYIK